MKKVQCNWFGFLALFNIKRRRSFFKQVDSFSSQKPQVKIEIRSDERISETNVEVSSSKIVLHKEAAPLVGFFQDLMNDVNYLLPALESDDDKSHPISTSLKSSSETKSIVDIVFQECQFVMPVAPEFSHSTVFTFSVN